MKKLFTSKRFIAFVISVILFVGILFFTQYTPIESATAISIIAGIYIGAETLRNSTNENIS